MEGESLDTDMGLGSLHFPLDSDGAMATEGSLLSGLTSVAMIDDTATADHSLSDGSMMTSSGLELGDYVPQTAIDVASTLPSFTNEVLFQNSSLPQVGPVLATHENLYGASLQRPPALNSGHISHSPQPFANQDFNFPSTQARVQYGGGPSKSETSLTNTNSFQPSIAGTNLAQTNDHISTYRFPTVGIQGPNSNHFQFTSAPARESHVPPPQSNLLLNGAPGFRQPALPHLNTTVQNANNTFTLRVPLPTTMTKGLRVHLVATGQGQLPITPGSNVGSSGPASCQTAQPGASSVMLFRDKITGKNFLVPTVPPAITNTLSGGESIPNEQPAELSSAPSSGAEIREETLGLPVVKQVFDVNEFLNIPQKEQSRLVDVNDCMVEQEPTSEQSDNSDEQGRISEIKSSESKLLVDDGQAGSQTVEVGQGSHGYQIRQKNTLMLSEVQPEEDGTEGTPVATSASNAGVCDLDLNTAKTGEDLIKMMSVMARKRNVDQIKPVSSIDPSQIEPRILDRAAEQASDPGEVTATDSALPVSVQSFAGSSVNEKTDETINVQSPGNNTESTDSVVESVSTDNYVEMRPVSTENDIYADSRTENETISNENGSGTQQISVENGPVVGERMGTVQQHPVGGAIVQTEKRIANLVPDSMKDFVRDIFEDEDALDKDCIRHIMQDTAAAPTSQAPAVTAITAAAAEESKTLTADAVGKLAVQTLSDNELPVTTNTEAEVSVQVDESQCVLVDGLKRWKCNVCPKMYSTKHNLIIHILSHCGVKPHGCGICGKSFKQTSHLQTHMLSHSNVKPHVCKTCNKSFTQASHLKRHSAIHMDKKPHICEICSRGFAFPSELRQHKEKHANGEENICSDCGQSFDTPKALKHHKNAVHWANKEKLHCKDCNKEFVFPSQLRDHMMKHSGKRPYICGECGMDFMKEHHLKSHLFTHTGLQPFHCTICDKSFNQKANLQRHMLIHEENKHKCHVCDRTFAQPQVLKSHVQTHAEEKAYQCTECGKRFSRRHNLNGHMALHSGSKKYVCFCGAAFTLKGNLNRHRNTKHGLSDASLLVSDDTAAEAAAQILNEMSAKRIQPPVESGASPGEFETSQADTSEGILQWPADINIEFSDLIPKKKRKSVPRKTKNKVEKDMKESCKSMDSLAGADVVGDPNVKRLKPHQNVSKLSESDDSNLSPAKPSSARRRKKAVAKATSVQAEVEQDDVEQEWQRLADDAVTPDQSQHADTSRDSLHDVQNQLSRVWTDLRKLEDTNGCHGNDNNHGNKQHSDDFVMEVDEHGRPKDPVTILTL